MRATFDTTVTLSEFREVRNARRNLIHYGMADGNTGVVNPIFVSRLWGTYSTQKCGRIRKLERKMNDANGVEWTFDKF